MSRSTIDFGIDLGTTNSAIAVLRGTSTEIVKNNESQDITASAVYIDRRGLVRTGLHAKNMLARESTSDDVFVEFKRRMGTAYEYHFRTSGRTMMPEDLSAEILKALRGDVRQQRGEDVLAAVITVPAAFEQKQCAATRLAGELAGLRQCPLVQEPVAAALAYGFQADTEKEYWLVYDFGGGTFDAAILRAEDGTITVLNHGGDNYLGGSDIDWALLEKLVIPELAKNYNLPYFTRGNKQWRVAMARLKHSAEAAKIQLSRAESISLEDCTIKDVAGNEIQVAFELTRDGLVSVAEPIIMRSVRICKRVLKEKNLEPSAISRVILVGGPTLAPYFRDILHASLGIALDYSLDPLTVVARGAAIFAGTQRVEGDRLPKAVAGQFSIDLKHKPIGAEPDPTVRGVVASPAGADIVGFTVEFVNELTRWRSGRVPVGEDGRFKVSLLAERGAQNVFRVVLLDARGNSQTVVPDSLAYTIGAAISEQPIINSISVALANNEVQVFFKKGSPLPAKATHVLRSTHLVLAGSSDHILNVPVVEGESETADYNRVLGMLVLTGTEIRRDLPADSEIEVTLHMDASRILLAKAYVPLLDEEFATRIDQNRASPDPERLQAIYDVQLDKLEGIRSRAADSQVPEAQTLLQEIAGSAALADIGELLEVAPADPDAAHKAEKRLLELWVRIDKAESAIEMPAFVSDVRQMLDRVDSLVEDHGNEERQRRAADLRCKTEELIQQGRAEALHRKNEEIRDLRNEILFEQPAFWMGFFNHLREQRDRMNDPAAADRLDRLGEQCISRGDVQGLRSVVAQLLGLMPDEVAQNVQRGYQSGVLKG